MTILSAGTLVLLSADEHPRRRSLGRPEAAASACARVPPWRS